MCMPLAAAGANAPASPARDDRSHTDRIKDAAGNALFDVAAVPIPANNVRTAIAGGMASVLLPSPTNTGEQAALRQLDIDAMAIARNARRDH